MSSRILNIEIHKPDYIGSPRVTTQSPRGVLVNFQFN